MGYNPAELRYLRKGIVAASRALRGIDPRKVVFSCFQGRNYGDNPRYISERLHERCPGAKIVWLFRQDALEKVRPRLPDYVIPVSMKSMRAYAELATARVWVDNYTKNNLLTWDPERQFYIQTWHGDRGFKRVGFDDEKSDRSIPRVEARCAMMIAGSEFGRSTYRTAFGFQGEVLMDGCPRNDLLMRNDPHQAAEIRAALGIDGATKLLLYAPTYRDMRMRQSQRAVLDVPATLDHLERRTGECWRCLYRAHYMNTSLVMGTEDPRLIDATDYPEMTELLLISDMLITDYSSCGADFTLLRRPMFLYHADREEYLNQCRSFYFDIEKSPFLVAHSQRELEALIDRTDAKAARENGEALDRFFGTTETGRASDAVCDYIIARLGGSQTGGHQ